MTNPIRDYWLKHKDKNFWFCKAVKCADGFTMSVQASNTHYCHPREYLEDGDYSQWEVGYPNKADELLMPYAEDEERPTDTVYGYVPTQVINEIIAKHGGIAVAAPMKHSKRSA